MTWRALDLFCGAGGVSVGLQRAGFEVTGVDIRDLAKYYRGGTFVQADALTFPLDGFDFVHASPPCQAHSSLRHLHPGREYPDLIEPVRERLMAWGGPYSIENVPGAPLGGAHLVMLCGTMFGLQTPDGRAEIRRHRLFELSFCPNRQPPPCRHGGGAADDRQGHLFGDGETARAVLTITGTHGLPGLGAREVARRQALSVTGSGLDSNRERWALRSKVLTVTGHTPVDNTGRRVISVVGGSPEGWSPGTGRRKGHGGDGAARETFSVDDARAAMGIDWMPMKYLSQAIPPAYAEWIGRQALRYLEAADLTPSRFRGRIGG